MTHLRRLRAPATLLLLAILMLAIPATALAGAAAASQAEKDIESALEGIVNFFAGPIAMAVCIIAVIIAGVAYATTDGNKKQLFTVLLGVTIALFAAQLVTYLGRDIASGATTIDIDMK